MGGMQSGNFERRIVADALELLPLHSRYTAVGQLTGVAADRGSTACIIIPKL